ncbi:MAG: DNA polymerase [Dehalococcoidales bacterium]
MRVHLDFETRSVIDLKKQGMHRYAEDPSTEVLCLAYAFDDGPVQLWHRGHPDVTISNPPDDLLSFVGDRRTVLEAHNANFERCIWANSGQRMGWPLIADHQWRCTAAKAASHNLPRKLEHVSHALNLAVKKDIEGHRLMLKLSKPRKPTKHNDALWHEKPEELARVWEYCKDDVVVERLLSYRLDDLPFTELEVFRADMQINQRGIACDRAMIAQALTIIDETVKQLNHELLILTTGRVQAASQREKLLLWLNWKGVKIYDMQGTTIDLAIDMILSGGMPVPPEALRALEIYRAVNRTSTAKYETMRLYCCRDGRIRGTLLYHGAGQTGRWSGRGVQTHNFPRGKIKDMDSACDDVLTGDKTWLETLYGDPMEFLSWTLRGALIAGEGKDLIVADYRAIEARVTFWHANDQIGLDVFRRGEDIYKFTAAEIYKVLYDAITEDQRQMGKQAVLGLGFGMGWVKFKETCASYGIEITDEFAQMVVKAFRKKYHKVVSFWYDCERAAILAVENPGKAYRVNRIMYGCKDGFLFCRLPSGRKLAYYDPKIQMKETPWGEMRPALTFMGTDAKTHKWVRQHTYGGKEFENIVQGTARDLLAAAILRAEDTGRYPIILSVHDEPIAEVDEGTGSVEEFESILTISPTWADGLPIGAKGWRGKRYKK